MPRGSVPRSLSRSFLGENNVLRSRYLLIGLTDDDKAKLRQMSGEGGKKKVVRKGGAGKKGTTQKTTQKNIARTTQKILALVKKDSTITRIGMAKAIGITPDGVKKALENQGTGPCGVVSVGTGPCGVKILMVIGLVFESLIELRGKSE